MMSIDSGMWPRTTILHVARIISLFLYLPHEDALQRERVETTAEFLSSCLVDIANEIIADTATTGAGSLMTHTQASSVSRWLDNLHENWIRHVFVFVHWDINNCRNIWKIYEFWLQHLKFWRNIHDLVCQCTNPVREIRSNRDVYKQLHSEVDEIPKGFLQKYAMSTTSCRSSGLLKLSVPQDPKLFKYKLTLP